MRGSASVRKTVMIRGPATGGSRSVEEVLTIADDLRAHGVVGIKIVADKPLRQLLQGGGEFVFTMTAALAGSSEPSSTSAPWPGWRHSVA